MCRIIRIFNYIMLKQYCQEHNNQKSASPTAALLMLFMPYSFICGPSTFLPVIIYT